MQDELMKAEEQENSLMKLKDLYKDEIKEYIHDMMRQAGEDDAWDDEEFEHAFKEAISSRTHDYVTAEASLLVGVSNQCTVRASAKCTALAYICLFVIKEIYDFYLFLLTLMAPFKKLFQ